jgi:hypothetical protein
LFYKSLFLKILSRNILAYPPIRIAKNRIIIKYIIMIYMAVSNLSILAKIEQIIRKITTVP